MKKTRKFLTSVLLIFFSFILTISVNATYYNGGEMTWECTSTGGVRLILKLYEDCGAGMHYPSSLNIQTNAVGIGVLHMNRDTAWNISPQCNAAGPFISCNGATQFNTGAAKMVVFTSDSLYPTGIPVSVPPGDDSVYFKYSSCCPNPSTSVTSAINDMWIIETVLYPDNNSQWYCNDNGPVFKEAPVMAHNAGVPSILNFYASDVDNDSLVYSLVQPFVSPITYAFGYSFQTPLPTTVHNPLNIPLTIDPLTGMGSFQSYTPGSFVVKVQVASYKCSQLVSTVTREHYVFVNTHGNNLPPVIVSPFTNSVGQYTLDTMSFVVGSQVIIPINTYDTTALGISTQNVSVWIQSNQLDSLYNNGGCLTPPCATVSPLANYNNPTPDTALITWNTSCAHISDGSSCNQTNEYNFLVQAKDDFCPVPAYNYRYISVFIKDLPLINPPDSVTAVFDSVNQITTISWVVPQDTLNSFHGYVIMHSITGNPYTSLDTITNHSQTSYVYIHPSGIGNVVNFYIVSLSGCHGGNQSDSSNVVSITLPSGIGVVVQDINDFIIFPNPASNHIRIKWETKIGDYDVQIMDMQGRLLKELSVYGSEVTLNVADLPKGKLILRILHDEQVYYKSFIRR